MVCTTAWLCSVAIALDGSTNPVGCEASEPSRIPNILDAKATALDRIVTSGGSEATGLDCEVAALTCGAVPDGAAPELDRVALELVLSWTPSSHTLVPLRCMETPSADFALTGTPKPTRTMQSIEKRV